MGRRSYRSQQAFGNSQAENRGQMEQLLAGRRKRPALHKHQHFSPIGPPTIAQPVDRDSKRESGGHSVTDFLDSLFEPVLSGSMDDLTNPTSLQSKLKGRGGMPPPPPVSHRKPPGAVPLFGPHQQQSQEDVQGAVANMAAAFAQRQPSRRTVRRDDASSVASEPMSDFAKLLAAKRAALVAKADNQENRGPHGIASAGTDLQSQLLAKRRAMMSKSDSDEDFPPPPRLLPQATFHSPSSADDEILLSAPPPPSFPPPPPPGDVESLISPPALGDPFAPSSHYMGGSEHHLADALHAAVTSVSGLDSGLLRRGKPVRLLRTIQGPAVTYNRPLWSVSIRKEVREFVVFYAARLMPFVSDVCCK